MIALFCLFLALFPSPFKSKSRLEAENAALRHQLIILRRKVRGRVASTRCSAFLRSKRRSRTESLPSAVSVSGKRDFVARDKPPKWPPNLR
jgi:hypothetical protein